MSKYQNIIIEVKDKVGIITLDRKDHNNSLDSSISKEIFEAMNELQNLNKVHVILLFGNKKFFSPGADINELKAHDKSSAEDKQLFSYFDKILEIKIPIIACVDGYALGGLAVGENQSEMFDAVDAVKDILPKDKPHYLMGVGMPQDILGAVKRGIDMFDCVLPTRSGRTGLAFTWNGKINIRNAKYAKDEDPLDKSIDCPASNLYSKNYLNHLVNSNEILGSMLLTWHNIAFYQDLMKKIRSAIKENKFDAFYKKHFELFNEAN